MASYQEELARWRMERRQAEIADRVEQIRQEHAETSRERDTALANGDTETAEFRDKDCEQLEAEYNEYVPPQQPQVHPQWATWIRRNSNFIEREGQRGVQAVTDALAYMQRPRNPNTTDPKYTGMGLSPQQIFTKQGLDKLETLLETHGQQFYGVKYDASEKALTPTQAAKISGLSADAYNNASRQLAAAGKFTKR
jgi:hypothetical protein